MEPFIPLLKKRMHDGRFICHQAKHPSVYQTGQLLRKNLFFTPLLSECSRRNAHHQRKTIYHFKRSRLSGSLLWQRSTKKQVALDCCSGRKMCTCFPHELRTILTVLYRSFLWKKTKQTRMGSPQSECFI